MPCTSDGDPGLDDPPRFSELVNSREIRPSLFGFERPRVGNRSDRRWVVVAKDRGRYLISRVSTELVLS